MNRYFIYILESKVEVHSGIFNSDGRM